MKRILIIAAAACVLASCGVLREHELQQQMDAEMALCRTGDRDACGRYQLLVYQYRTEHIPRCGLLGLPCLGNSTINVQSN